MKRVSVFLIVLLFPAISYGWFGTKVDTVEVLYPNGQLKEQYQTVFYEGTGYSGKFGFYRSFYENGQMQWMGHYVEDEKVGSWINWDSTGFLMAESSFESGLKNGAEIEWNLDGTFRKFVYYKNDSLHGLCTWGKSGDMINGFFGVPDLIIDSQLYYLDGVPIVKLWKLNDTTSYFSMSGPQNLNYNKELDLWYECKGLEPSISMSNKTAAIFIGHKVDGKKDGIWIRRNKSGNMIKVEFYDNGTLVKLE